MKQGPAELFPRLLTMHNTAVYVDLTSGLLRHGPRADSPPNARLVLDGPRGEIMHDAAGSLQPLFYRDGSFRTITDDAAGSATPAVFELIGLSDARVALKANNKFLTADPQSGNLTPSASVCSGWEHFVLWDPPPDRRSAQFGHFARNTPSLSISCTFTYSEPHEVIPAVRAVEHTLECIRADCLYWFSNFAFPRRLPNIEVIHIHVPAFVDFQNDLTNICLNLTPRVVSTDFNLIVQPDGFAVNPQAWDDRFWEYDYIGASWPWMWGGGPYWGGPIVGNGGFSLRSRKLYNALLDLCPKWRVDDWSHDARINYLRRFDRRCKDFIPEDMVVSIGYRQILETKYDIAFCPPELANKFSVETMDPFTQYWLGRSFGFHGHTGVAPYYGVKL